MTALPAREAPAFESIDEIISYAMEKADGLWEEARSIAFGELSKIPSLYDSLSESLIRARIKDIIRKHSHDTRSSLLEPQPDRTRADGALAKMAVRNLYNFPLAGGRKLGDGSKSEVQDQARFYHTQAMTEFKRAHWLTIIAKGMGGREIVKSRYSLEDLTNLLAESEQWARKGGKK